MNRKTKKVSIKATQFSLKTITTLEKLAKESFKGLEGKEVVVTHKTFPSMFYEGKIGKDSSGYYIKALESKYNIKKGHKYSIAFNLARYKYFIKGEK